MKRLLAALSLVFFLSGAEAQQLINCATGTPCASGAPTNTGTGDSLYVAGSKINANFEALPSALFSGAPLPIANGGTGTTSSTGTGNSVLSNSPTLVTPALGAATASSINGTSIPSSATLPTISGSIASGSPVLASNSSGQLIASAISTLGGYSIACNSTSGAAAPTGCASVPGRSLIWQQLRNGYIANRYNNPHYNAVMSSPPTVTLNSSNPILNPNKYSVANPDTTYNTLFTVSGGDPVYYSAGNAYRYQVSSVSPASQPGNVSTTSNGVAWRLKLQVDSAAPVFQFVQSSVNVRFIVNGQYVNTTGTTPSNAGTGNYIQLSFGSRAIRQILVEGQQGTAFISASVAANERITPASKGIKVTLLGDSLSTGSGTNPVFGADSYATVIGDSFGIGDLRQSGIGGQGVITDEAVGGWNLSNRLTPATNSQAFLVDAPPSDLFILAMGTNDASSSNSLSAISTAYQGVLNQLLTQYPTTPIIVLGCPANNTGPAEVNATTDLGISAAVAATNSPLVLFVPDASLGTNALETGVGNTSTLSSGTVTLTANPSGSSSGTLTAAFAGPTGIYSLVFADGALKYTTLTNGSTAVSWPGTVTESSPSIVYGGAKIAATFTASANVGQTSATLTSSWGEPTGTYFTYFTSGEVRAATYTASSTAVTWTDALAFAAGANVTAIGAATVPGDADIYYASGTGPHPNTAGHASRGFKFADEIYTAIRNY